MSVYKRGDTWWIKFNAGGRVVRRSAKTASKRQAQALERQLRIQKDTSHGVTYLQALTMWLETAPESMLSHARNTHEIYHVTLDKLPLAANRMGDKMLSDGLSPQTVNRRLAVVKRVLRLSFQKWDLIQAPLWQKIVMHSEKGKAREIYLTRDEVQQLVGAMDNMVARNIALVAAFTGLRRGELLKLRSDQWKPPYINLDSKTKSGKPRSVPLVEQLHGTMNALPFDITPHHLRKQVEKARTAIGRPEIRLHDLRHTFASWMISDPSIPMVLVRDLMGHSTLAVTSKYAHLRPESAGAVEAALGHMARHIGENDNAE